MLVATKCATVWLPGAPSFTWLSFLNVLPCESDTLMDHGPLGLFGTVTATQMASPAFVTLVNASEVLRLLGVNTRTPLVLNCTSVGRDTHCAIATEDVPIISAASNSKRIQNSPSLY